MPAPDPDIWRSYASAPAPGTALIALADLPEGATPLRVEGPNGAFPLLLIRRGAAVRRTSINAADHPQGGPAGRRHGRISVFRCQPLRRADGLQGIQQTLQDQDLRGVGIAVPGEGWFGPRRGRVSAGIGRHVVCRCDLRLPTGRRSHILRPVARISFVDWYVDLHRARRRRYFVLQAVIGAFQRRHAADQPVFRHMSGNDLMRQGT